MKPVTLQPLPQPAGAQPTPPRASDPARLRQAAQDFEAMAIGQFLQPIFDTADTSRALFGGGAGESAWRPMLVQEMAKKIAAAGGFGLARQIHDALIKLQEGHPE